MISRKILELPLWEIQTVVLAVLCVLLARRRDGRRFFEGLLWFDFVMQSAALVAQRTHFMPSLTTLVFLCNLGDIPLWYLAMQEAADYRPTTHRKILFLWIAASAGCAWIRFYPWTGTTCLWVNLVAYSLWIWQKIRMERVR